MDIRAVMIDCGFGDPLIYNVGHNNVGSIDIEYLLETGFVTVMNDEGKLRFRAPLERSVIFYEDILDTKPYKLSRGLVGQT